jgi:hypothetical protein
MVTTSSSATIEQVKCIELRGLIEMRRGDGESPTLLRNEEVYVANGTRSDVYLRIGAFS